ncbi:chaperone modulator CbpM [Aestuariibaculum sediminum]|uniref:MerR family transcriptional regulator n=1 Tax=Aestuariibaculum sediminum TaxID=2770637 RepID=A0A8J6Q108_9FLAO|nr:chaperone modulator CbpM [Aestuariibaculum sediminum]MBD0832762.1 hypothetical protein [Aestuariibaculum sediminum]
MKETVLISIQDIMEHHSLDVDFIDAIENYQLVTFVVQKSSKYIREDDMPRLEQIIRLHYDLEINMAGIEVIKHMLDKMEGLHDTIRKLQNKLNRYE